MKVTKWVETSQEVQIDIGADDIRIALQEAFSAVTKERPNGEIGPSRYDVTMALNNMAGFLNALTDAQIRMLTDAQIITVKKFLLRAATRFHAIEAKKVPSVAGGAA